MSGVFRARALPLVILAALSLGACSSAPKVPPFAGTPPKRIVLLPFEGSLSVRGRAALRRLLGSFLVDRQYIKIDDEIVDTRVAQMGWRPWERGWIPDDASLAGVARALGAGAVVVGQDLRDESVSAGILYRRGVYGTVRWIDAATAKTLWSVEVGSSRTGGVALESGQVLKALSETVESSSDDAFVRLAAKLAFELAEAVPAHPESSEVAVRPQIAQVSAQPGDGVLRPGDMLTLRVNGTPGGRARASFAGIPGAVPLAESEPGVYATSVKILPGMGVAQGPVIATVYDVTGQPSEPRSSPTPVRIDAPRVDSPSEFTASVEPGTRRVRLAWKSAPGAVRYSVARIAGGPPVTLDAGAAQEWVDTVPAGPSQATYAVAGAGASGLFGPPSATVVVNLN